MVASVVLWQGAADETAPGGNRAGFGGATLVVAEPVVPHEFVQTIEAIGTTYATSR
ncbi:MAG: hypothetical protein HC809_05580 [Gammaproteobacteria bacterium]|nr:hypothetical protein [Gammaproteobacteria bacterium]